MGPCLSALQYFKMSENCEAPISIFDARGRAARPRPPMVYQGPRPPHAQGPTVSVQGVWERKPERWAPMERAGLVGAQKKYAPPAGEGLEAGRELIEGKHRLVGQ